MSKLEFSYDALLKANFVPEMIDFWQSVGAPVQQADGCAYVARWLDDLHSWLIPDELCDQHPDGAWLEPANKLLRPKFQVICAHLEQFEMLVRLRAPEQAFRDLLESLSC